MKQRKAQIKQRTKRENDAPKGAGTTGTARARGRGKQGARRKAAKTRFWVFIFLFLQRPGGQSWTPGRLTHGASGPGFCVCVVALSVRRLFCAATKQQHRLGSLCGGWAGATKHCAPLIVHYSPPGAIRGVIVRRVFLCFTEGGDCDAAAADLFRRGRGGGNQTFSAPDRPLFPARCYSRCDCAGGNLFVVSEGQSDVLTGCLIQRSKAQRQERFDVEPMFSIRWAVLFERGSKRGDVLFSQSGPGPE